METPNKQRKRMRVAIVSERRADYSRFKPILIRMRDDPDSFDYRLIVTGISILKEYGEDIKTIKNDGFEIHEILPMYKENAPDTGAEMTRAYSRIMMGLTNVFEKLKPDMILTGFDIGANFVAAIVGAHMNIHVAHIQGGELTGSIDESLRHATSKFAHIHFPATTEAGERLKQMGENPRFIFVVGCPSIDLLLQTKVMPRSEIISRLKLREDEPYLLVVQHPVTTEQNLIRWQINQTIQAIKEIGIQTIILYPNNDAGSQTIILSVKKSPFRYVKSFPPEIFANVLRHCGVLIGNASTGIHESATFHIPTVNIGTRQQGRQRPKNVIDVDYDKNQIIAAIRRSLYDKKFKKICANAINPYGTGRASERIVKILKRINLKQIPLQKSFMN